MADDDFVGPEKINPPLIKRPESKDTSKLEVSGEKAKLHEKETKKSKDSKVKPEKKTKLNAATKEKSKDLIRP